MPTTRSHRIIRWARVVWTLAPIAVLVALAILDLVPSGHVRVSAWPVSSRLVRGPVPEQRVAPVSVMSGAVSGFRLLGEPVYIDVHQSRPFRTLTVNIELDPGSAQVVEFGLSPGGQPGSIILQAGYHRALELLRSSGWTENRSAGLTLLQRQPRYSSVEDFLRQPPAASRIAVYRVPFALAFAAPALPPDGPTAVTDFILTGYQPSGKFGGWRTVATTFTLTPAHQAANTLRLVVSVPERPLPDQPVAVRRLSLTLSGERISRRVLSGWFSRWFRRNS